MDPGGGSPEKGKWENGNNLKFYEKKKEKENSKMVIQ
jgi:hypothetical protein